MLFKIKIYIFESQVKKKTLKAQQLKFDSNIFKKMYEKLQLQLKTDLFKY